MKDDTEQHADDADAGVILPCQFPVVNTKEAYCGLRK